MRVLNELSDYVYDRAVAW